MPVPTSVIKDISPLDTMLDNGEDNYFMTGEAALTLCKTLLGHTLPRRLLDFPSGYGRALRWFKAEWSKAEIYAVETDRNALEFVEKTFGAYPVVADPRLDMIIPGDMDLIFTGSLLTHFDDWQWDKYLRMCINALAADGILVFTTHGRVAALQVRDNKHFYGDIIAGDELYARYKQTGFAYLPYAPAYPEFGVSLSSPEWIMRKLQALSDVKIVLFQEQGWGQDVVALRKNPWPMVRD